MTEKKKKALPKGAEPYKFRPGQSGNPNGRPKRKPFTQAVLEAIGDSKLLQKLVQAQINKALKGDGRAFAELRNTVQGKPSQEIVIEGGDEPVKFQEVSDVDSRIAELLKRAGSRGAQAK